MQCQLNQTIVSQTSDGLMCKRGNTNILRIDKSDVGPRIDAFQGLLMNRKYIGNVTKVHNPRS
jgi:hypothetical protein